MLQEAPRPPLKTPLNKYDNKDFEEKHQTKRKHQTQHSVLCVRGQNRSIPPVKTSKQHQSTSAESQTGLANRSRPAAEAQKGSEALKMERLERLS